MLKTFRCAFFDFVEQEHGVRDGDFLCELTALFRNRRNPGSPDQTLKRCVFSMYSTCRMLNEGVGVKTEHVFGERLGEQSSRAGGSGGR